MHVIIYIYKSSSFFFLLDAATAAVAFAIVFILNDGQRTVISTVLANTYINIMIRITYVCEPYDDESCRSDKIERTDRIKEREKDIK